jgi:Domain of unknown function (DUF1844)
MPNQDFVGLVNTLQATAEAALGELNASSALARRDGLTETPARARETAQRSLRLLTMLAEKTRGNLDLTESELLSEAVARLRERLAN